MAAGPAPREPVAGVGLGVLAAGGLAGLEVIDFASADATDDATEPSFETTADVVGPLGFAELPAGEGALFSATDDVVAGLGPVSALGAAAAGAARVAAAPATPATGRVAEAAGAIAEREAEGTLDGALPAPGAREAIGRAGEGVEVAKRVVGVGAPNAARPLPRDAPTWRAELGGKTPAAIVGGAMSGSDSDG